jgi:hypothetical protein
MPVMASNFELVRVGHGHIMVVEVRSATNPDGFFGENLKRPGANPLVDKIEEFFETAGPSGSLRTDLVLASLNILYGRNSNTCMLGNSARC